MDGPKPNPQEYKDETGHDLEIQTDKPLWKIVECTYAGCGVDLIVNVFYAPHKAKCAAHGTKSNTAVAASRLTFTSDTNGVVSNGALAKLLCPICQTPLTLFAIEQESGWLRFRCVDGFGKKGSEIEGKVFCRTSISIKPNWGSLEFMNIPSEFKKLVEDFNLDQKMKYLETVGF